MSFDLGVWRYPGHHMTSEEASRHYANLCGRPFGSFVPGAEMSAFVEVVAGRMNADGGPGGGPWAALPDIGEDSALMAFQSGFAERALAIVSELAMEHGLVCFDPRESTVYQPQQDLVDENTRPTLEFFDGQKITDPSGDQIEMSVRSLSRDRWYVILEVGRQRYLQVGYGENAGAKAGSYVLEYREGSPAAHFRATTSDVGACVSALQEYRRGVLTWNKRFSFERVSV